MTSDILLSEATCSSSLISRLLRHACVAEMCDAVLISSLNAQ
ncbi:hypothetical protein ACFQUX_04165 [Pantoea stewartii]